MKTLKLAHLYPKDLDGDIGNILALKKRCEWRGIELVVDEINIGDEIKEYDIYFLGGGEDAKQSKVSIELQKHKDFLHQQRDKMSVFLGICGGFQLLGNYYELPNGEKLSGLGFLDVYTISGEKRLTGNVTVNTDLVEPNTLVGFENHAGKTYLQSNTEPLGQISVGGGNNGEDKTEGARYKNVFGTYLHGPFLPKNPHFADYLIELALGSKPELLDDEIEKATHKALVGKKY